jgi:hypothetical protein
MLVPYRSIFATGCINPMNILKTILAAEGDLSPRQQIPRSEHNLKLYIREALETSDEKGRRICWYVIVCQFEGSMWSVQKRFSQFVVMDKNLRKGLRQEDRLLLPAFPRNQLISFNTKNEVQLRKRSLEVYLSGLASLSDRVANADVSVQNEGRNRSLIHVHRALVGFIDFARRGEPSSHSAGPLIRCSPASGSP